MVPLPHKLSMVVLLISALAALTASSCDISCEGGSWQTLPQVSCDAPMGGASLASPASYALPADLAVTSGQTCLGSNGACANPPFVRLDTPARSDGSSFHLILTLPASEGPATHTLPVTRPDPYVGVDAYIFSQASAAVSLRAVAGTVTVETSSRTDLRLTFDVELESQDTMERFSITGGTATVSGCSVHQQRTCVGGD